MLQRQYQVKHLDNTGSTIMEIMVMLTILGLAMAAVFSTVTSGIRFSKNSENRIKAIALAKEWIEGVINLRNTNWLRFSSDRTNCWKTQNYDSTCIGSTSFMNNLTSGPYTLDNKNGAWYLSGGTTGSGLWVDSNGYYNSTGSTSLPRCNTAVTTNCISVFSRVIQISNATNTGMTLQSIVNWHENKPQQVILETTLTNWKSKF